MFITLTHSFDDEKITIRKSKINLIERSFEGSRIYIEGVNSPLNIVESYEEVLKKIGISNTNLDIDLNIVPGTVYFNETPPEKYTIGNIVSYVTDAVKEQIKDSKESEDK
ncbi:MAG: hypothetical protein CMP22_07770 [Rickettsiales bacterium]|nr:hypothetical protein [Rickettsiales bacterium]|tara:strand:+ start:1268 stop:1597 length:330 start_codon:yes stop_codon:yes gene_type:complete